MIRIVGDAGPYPLLLGLFVLVAVLGQLVSNTATALIVIPIAWKLGLPLMSWYAIIAIAVVPLIWRF